MRAKYGKPVRPKFRVRSLVGVPPKSQLLDGARDAGIRRQLEFKQCLHLRIQIASSRHRATSVMALMYQYTNRVLVGLLLKRAIAKPPNPTIQKATRRSFQASF